MAIKKYHVSKNLFDGSLEQGTTGYGDLLPATNRVRSNIFYLGAGTFTFSCTNSEDYRIALDYNSSDGTYVDGTEWLTTKTFDVTNSAPQIRLKIKKSNEADFTPQDINNIMLNTGSTALPYEPYGNTWNSIPYRKYETATDTLTSLPADVIADGQSASANIIGNMEQTGTPSPSSIIMPSECGERTKNLLRDLPNSTEISGVVLTVDKQSGTITANGRATSDVRLGIIIPSNVAGDFYYSGCPADGGVNKYDIYSWDSTTSTRAQKWDGTTSTPNDNDYGNGMSEIKVIQGHTTLLAVRIWSGYTASNLVFKPMLRESTESKEYEPYGYKIPISSGGTTTPVYLGEVQSTRKIKKYEMTGSEDITYQSAYSRFYFTRTDAYYSGTVRTTPCICSHYQSIHDGRAIDDVPNESIYVTTSYIKTTFNIKTTDFTDVTDFKAYLAQQYAAGTPVTVWYVLATPTTTTLNEPIRKIGNYADSVSVTGIPTTGTTESFDIDTDLKPSEVDLTYHGWHEHSDTKFTT